MALMHEIVPVFVSSKQSEFIEERKWIFEKLSAMELLAPDMMEDWGPTSQSAQQLYLDRVRNAMVYVGLFGCKFSQPTSEEYRASRENRYKESLVYIRACPQRDPELQTLIDEMNQIGLGHVSRAYTNWSEIEPNFERHLWDAVGRMAKAYHRLGQAPSRAHGGATDQLRALYGSHADVLGLEYQEAAGILEGWLGRHQTGASAANK